MISERILRGIEERRRCRKETKSPRPPAAPTHPSAGPVVLSPFLAELDRSIRESIQSSLSRWEAALVSQIEDLTRRLAPTPPPQAPRDADSWGKLAQAVRELREEWEREITKIRGSGSSQLPADDPPSGAAREPAAFHELKRKLDELIGLLKSSTGGESASP